MERPQHLLISNHSPRAHQGRPLAIRPVQPSDAQAIADFLLQASGTARYQRYLSIRPLSRPALEREVTRIVSYDRQHDITILAEAPCAESMEVVAVAELLRTPDGASAELALLVRDDEQRKGLGSALVRQLLVSGQLRGLQHVLITMLAENLGMRHLLAGLDLPYRSTTEYGATSVVIDLHSAAIGMPHAA